MKPCTYDDTRKGQGYVVQTGAATAGEFTVAGKRFFSTCPASKEEAVAINEIMAHLEMLWELDARLAEVYQREMADAFNLKPKSSRTGQTP